MKLRYTFEDVEMGQEIISVPVGEGADHVKGILKSNMTGHEIIELLKEDISVDMIVNKLAEKYEDSIEVLREYVYEVINKLKKAGLIQE